MTDKEIEAFKHRIHVKEWKARNPEKVKAYKRIGYLRRKARLNRLKPKQSPNPTSHETQTHPDHGRRTR